MEKTTNYFFWLKIGLVLCLATLWHEADAQQNQAITDRYSPILASEYNELISQLEVQSYQDSETLYLLYKAKLYGKQASQDQLDATLSLLNSQFPESFENHYAQYLHSDKKETQHLLDAYKINPNHPDAWDDMLRHAYIQNDQSTLKIVAKKIIQEKKYSDRLIKYAKNVVASVGNNAILVTQGELDTAPLLAYLVNSGKNIPNFICLDWLKHTAYKTKVNNQYGVSASSGSFQSGDFMQNFQNQHPNSAIHFSLMMRSNLLQTHQSKLYLVGLTARYSSSTFDNIPANKSLYNKLNINQIATGNSRDTEDRLLMTNYLPYLQLMIDYGNLNTSKTDTLKAAQARINKQLNR